MEIKEKFLPIGTIVRLKGGKKRLMITGFCLSTPENNEIDKLWDYAGYPFPEGNVPPYKIGLFNHDMIEEVFYYGLEEDEEEKEFKKNLKEFFEKKPKEKIELERQKAIVDAEEQLTDIVLEQQKANKEGEE